ncbi:dATP/dGTP diphosphohydrolase MazZ domain-containing protein [Phytobacter sp. AG2a]
MNKFTKEQLVNYVKGCIEHAERFPGVEIADKEKAIFEIALAELTNEPVQEREQVRREHAEWSQATFGSVGPIGPLKHLSKEALEAAAEPGDLSEWADMQFLLWDAQRRAGITDEQITAACIEKLAINKLRQWPAPKEGEPRLHVRGEDEAINARRRRNRESNTRARERETPTQRKARLAKNRERMAIRRKGGGA